MAPKLGEILIRAGKITTEDLDEALTSQIFFGGKLGTHLIEMGCIEEHELTRYLSRITGMPAVKPGQLDAVPPEIIQLVSAEMAERYRIIPLQLANKRLEVAMADPINFLSVDEISFATGFIIIPHLASEPTIARYLKKHYQIKEKERVHRIEGESRHRPRPEKNLEELEQLAPVKTATEDVLLFPPLDSFEGFHIDYDMEEQQPADEGSTTSESSPLVQEQGALTEEIAARLCEAEDRDAVAALLLQYAGTKFLKVALFIIKKDAVCGWKAIVRQRPVPGFGDVSIPLDTSFVLTNVIEKKALFEGKLPGETGDARIAECLGGDIEEVIALPLLLLNRVVAILYLAGATDRIDMAEMQKVAAKTTMALEILILKNKILMT